MIRFVFLLALATWLAVSSNVFAFEVPVQYRQGITVVHDGNMAPMSFFGLNREPKGFVIDLWRKWSEVTGVPVTFKLMNWKEGIEYVLTHDDAVQGGLFRTEERSKDFIFSDEFYQIETALFVLKGADVEDIDDLAGHHVGVLEAGAAQEIMRTRYPDVLLKTYRSVEEQVAAFVAGKVEAVVIDYPTLMYQAGSFGALKGVIPLETLYSNHLRAGVAKRNAALLDLVGRGIERIDARSREQILHRWFVSDSRSSKNLKIVVALSLVGLIAALGFLFCSGRRSHRIAQEEDTSID